jgi:hypothetical protein
MGYGGPQQSTGTGRVAPSWAVMGKRSPKGVAMSIDLDDLPMDVFRLADQGLEVKSLTAGHGMTEMGASSNCFCYICCSCCCAEKAQAQEKSSQN